MTTIDPEVAQAVRDAVHAACTGNGLDDWTANVYATELVVDGFVDTSSGVNTEAVNEYVRSLILAGLPNPAVKPTTTSVPSLGAPHRDERKTR